MAEATTEVLGHFVVMVLAAGMGILGRLHWRLSGRAFAAAEDEYAAALARHKEASEDEKPAHQVTLARPFCMGKCEVTQGRFSPDWHLGSCCRVS
jgi:formylglycine-generating enzyme required for sulfatase activity